MLWENTFFMTSTYNNAKMQWPYSWENMLETVWYDPLCLYCSCGGWSLQDTAHLVQLSCWLFTCTPPCTHTHVCTQLLWAGNWFGLHYFSSLFFTFQLFMFLLKSFHLSIPAFLHTFIPRFLPAPITLSHHWYQTGPANNVDTALLIRLLS